MLGAIIGDICGSIYEFDPIEVREFSLMKYGVDFTDDSVLTVAVADAILYNKDFAINLQLVPMKTQPAFILQQKQKGKMLSSPIFLAQ
jgi:ADP-ribosylglycohydrolase